MHGKQKTHTYLTQQTSVDNGGHTVNQPLLIIQQKLMEQTTLSNHAIKEMWTFSTTFWFSMLLVALQQNFLVKPSQGAQFRGGDIGSCYGYLAASPQAGGCGDVDYGYDAAV